MSCGRLYKFVSLYKLSCVTVFKGNCWDKAMEDKESCNKKKAGSPFAVTYSSQSSVVTSAVADAATTTSMSNKHKYRIFIRSCLQNNCKLCATTRYTSYII